MTGSGRVCDLVQDPIFGHGWLDLNATLICLTYADGRYIRAVRHWGCGCAFSLSMSSPPLSCNACSDPMALVDAINLAQAEKATAATELEQIPETPELNAAQVEKLIDALGVIRAVLGAGKIEDRVALYAAMNIQANSASARRTSQRYSSPVRGVAFGGKCGGGSDSSASRKG